MRLLRIVIDGREHPNYTITKAFESRFASVETIWLERYSIPDLNKVIIQKVMSNQFDVVFMQIQRSGVIYPDTAKIMSDHSLVFNWTGDARDNVNAYAEIGNHVISLFTNENDVDKMSDLGFRADYLQCGYDDAHFFNKNEENRHHSVVFCGNNYPNIFPLSSQRQLMANHLKSRFANKFRLFGSGWGGYSLGYLDEFGANYVYNESLISINLSHYNYKRYYSDRLITSMASGILVLSHEYPDYRKDFIDGEHFVIWQDFNDLTEKIIYFFQNPDKAKVIADKGCKFVTENCKWTNRVDEFKQLINKYK